MPDSSRTRGAGSIWRVFNVGTAELLVILLVALLVLGPKKLPDAARQVGRALGELRRLSSGFQAEMRDALREPIEGTPASGSPTTPAKAGGALSSPKSAAFEADPTTPPPVAGDAGTGATGDAVEHAPPPDVGSQSGGDPVDGDGGPPGARTGRGGTATSPPTQDAGSNGSAPS